MWYRWLHRAPESSETEKNLESSSTRRVQTSKAAEGMEWKGHPLGIYLSRPCSTNELITSLGSAIAGSKPSRKKRYFVVVVSFITSPSSFPPRASTTASLQSAGPIRLEKYRTFLHSHRLTLRLKERKQKSRRGYYSESNNSFLLASSTSSPQPTTNPF